MIFRSQLLFSGVIALATVLLLACLNWQCLLLVFLVGGIGWGIWSSRDSSAREIPRDRAGSLNEETAPKPTSKQPPLRGQATRRSSGQGVQAHQTNKLYQFSARNLSSNAVK